jgi:hypothetical protein
MIGWLGGGWKVLWLALHVSNRVLGLGAEMGWGGAVGWGTGIKILLDGMGWGEWASPDAAWRVSKAPVTRERGSERVRVRKTERGQRSDCFGACQHEREFAREGAGVTDLTGLTALDGDCPAYGQTDVGQG